MSAPAPVDRRFFPPELVVQIKAIACELPATRGLPLSRLSSSDIVREAQRGGIVATIGDTTVWRWLHEDAICPWQHRCWIFPRDPQFVLKAGRILDLYAKRWQDKPLRSDEFVISADEKTSIQARRRKRPSSPPTPGRAARIEHEYARGGAWAYLAALDVHRAKIFGRCEPTTGIEPFGRLVAQVMSEAPYRTARRVFWILDNGSSHRGLPCVRRLKRAFPNLVPVHGPVHASWLNQIEIYFSIVQREARSLPMTSPRSARLNDDCSSSRITTKASLRLSTGSSPATTWPNCTRESSPPTGLHCPSPPNTLRCRIYEPDY